MLKKLLAILLCVASVACMAACADVQETTGNPVQGSTSHMPPPNAGIVPKDYEYVTFEEFCKETEYIVIANFVSESEFSEECMKLTFNVKSSLRGDLSGNVDVYLRTDEEGCGRVFAGGREILFSENYFEWLRENTDDIVLFLTLENVVEVFSAPQFTWHFATAINLTHLDASEMYNEPIAKHMTDFDFDNATSEDVLAYIKSLAESRN